MAKQIGTRRLYSLRKGHDNHPDQETVLCQVCYKIPGQRMSVAKIQHRFRGRNLDEWKWKESVKAARLDPSSIFGELTVHYDDETLKTYHCISCGYQHMEEQWRVEALGQMLVENSTHESGGLVFGQTVDERNRVTMYAVSGFNNEDNGMNDEDVVLRMTPIAELSDPEIAAEARVNLPGHYEFVPFGEFYGTPMGGKLYWVAEGEQLDIDTDHVLDIERGSAEGVWNMVSILNQGLEAMRALALYETADPVLEDGDPEEPVMRQCVVCQYTRIAAPANVCDECVEQGRHWKFERVGMGSAREDITGPDFRRQAGLAIRDLRILGMSSPIVWTYWTSDSLSRDRMLAEFRRDPLAIMEAITYCDVPREAL